MPSPDRNYRNNLRQPKNSRFLSRKQGLGFSRSQWRLILLSILGLSSGIGASVFISRQFWSDSKLTAPQAHRETAQLVAQIPNSTESSSPLPNTPANSGEPRQILGPQNLACVTPQPLTAEQRRGLGAALRLPELSRPAASSNFGDRETVDRSSTKKPVPHRPSLIVLHETVIPLQDALQIFQNESKEDKAQLSYHKLIGLDGKLYQLVADEKRAFGAGNSEFEGQAVKLNPKLPSSVNNIALHVSLETPTDGNREVPQHSGYTEAQYQTLSVVVSRWMQRWKISLSAITTHKSIDRDQTKKDPRSFDSRKFFSYLNANTPISCRKVNSL